MMNERTSDTQRPEYLSTGQAARILGISVRAARELVIRGRLLGLRVGRNWIIPRDALLEFAKDYVKGPGPQWKRAQRKRRQS